MSLRSLLSLIWVGACAALGFHWSYGLYGETQLSSTAKEGPFLVAHRGDEAVFPENSAEAFLSGARAGVDFVEMDIRRTADGVFVIHHDDYTGKTVECAGGKFPIAGVTWDFLQTSCRYKDLPEEQGRILSLAETLDLLKGTKTGLVLDVKPVIKEDVIMELADQLLALDSGKGCQRGEIPEGTYDCFANIIIYVNDVSAHNKLWRVAKGQDAADFRYRMLSRMKFLKIVGAARTALEKPEVYLDNDGIAFIFVTSSEADVQMLREQFPNKILAVWTLGKPEQYHAAVRLGMDGIITSRMWEFLELKDAD